jgi:enamine deaminase RidA (YjgF/YER057c/UK114 family)
MVHIEAKIKDMGIELPIRPPNPKGNYIPFLKQPSPTKGRTLIYVAGHLPQLSTSAGGALVTGRVGETLTAEEGAAAAKLCAVSILGTVRAAAGDLDKVTKIVKVVGFVNCTDDFISQPQVLNGASDFFVEVFGREIGAHARSAIGTNVLPLEVPVEIEAIVEVDE